jgi:hypothetical protein
MFAIWTKRTDIAGRLMHEAVADHFVLTLEAFPTFRADTAGDGTVVWAIL